MGDLTNNNMFRTRMVAQPEGCKSYLSLADAVRKLNAEGGIRAFYKGTYYPKQSVVRIRITLNADPDPSFYFDADPKPDMTFHFPANPDSDPVFHFDLDPDPTLHFERIRILLLIQVM